MAHEQKNEHGCGCDCGCDRRDFLKSAGAAASVLGSLSYTSLSAAASESGDSASVKKQPAVVRAVFLYPSSATFSTDSEGWWSWPGNEFDAEGRQREYTVSLQAMGKQIGVDVQIDAKPVGSTAEADRLIADLKANQPDGLLLVMFYNNSIALADRILAATEETEVPAIFYIGLGVKHGPVTKYRREGLYFIQSLDNMEAIESGVRMIHARKRMSQSRLLSVTEAPEVREGVEKFFGTTVRVIPFDRYAEYFDQVKIDAEAKQLIHGFTDGAIEQRGITQESLENAARAHLAIRRMLREENANGITMNCLRRGMLKPCMSFSTLNGQLIPAACENDLPAVYTQLLGQLLTGRPGFQHNPAFETERNHYYGSHCTCARKLHGPDGDTLPFLLRRFAHTNEGSTAIQVFFKPGDAVTIARYYPGAEPALDVYAGRVVESHQMPPAGGCTTNVEVEITDRQDAMMVSGHHNLMFCGDYARRFRMFANLYGMRLADTGYEGPWPG